MANSAVRNLDAVFFETTTTGNTGPIAIGGAATGFRTPQGAGMADGEHAYFYRRGRPADGDSKWELLLCTLDTGANELNVVTPLSDGVVDGSSGGGVRVNWTAGTRDMYAAPTSRTPIINESSQLLMPDGGIHVPGSVFVDTSSSAAAYVCSPTPALKAYQTGLYVVDFNQPNSGADPTIDISGLGTKTIKDANAGALAGGAIVEGHNVLAYDGTQFLLFAANAGKVLQQQIGTYATHTSTANRFPVDDTVPQNTEGAEAATVTITPGSASNILIIECLATLGAGAAASMGMGIFQDSIAGALKAAGGDNRTAGSLEELRVFHRMTAGTAAATTFKQRWGPDAGTGYINGSSSGRKFGGVMEAHIMVTELAA